MMETKNLSYGEKKTKFTKDVALLIQFVISKGYEIRFCPEHPNHMKNSLHFAGLAKDFELFKDGKYLVDTKDYLFAGEFWESLGNTWGGRFNQRGGIGNDGNHFSIAHEGRK